MGISCPKPHTWPTEGQKKKENRQDTSRENPLQSLREDMAGPRQAQSHGRTSLLISVPLPTNTPRPRARGGRCAHGALKMSKMLRMEVKQPGLSRLKLNSTKMQTRTFAVAAYTDVFARGKKASRVAHGLVRIRFHSGQAAVSQTEGRAPGAARGSGRDPLK